MLTKQSQGMLYLINFDIKDNTRKDNFLSSIKDLGNFHVFMPGALFLDCSHLGMDKNSICNELKKILNDVDLILVVEIRFDHMSGWLTSSAVGWLKGEK